MQLPHAVDALAEDLAGRFVIQRRMTGRHQSTGTDTTVRSHTTTTAHSDAPGADVDVRSGVDGGNGHQWSARGVSVPGALPLQAAEAVAGAVSPELVVDLVEADALAERAHSSYVRWVKPVVDAVLALVLILLSSPVLLAAALLVRFSLGGPVLFLQERVGLDGRPFRVIKFRTMHPSRRRHQRPFAGPDRRRTHKHPDDPRLTGVGRFLRKSSIDELPQLFNVLKGDMSLVGPRPELPTIVEAYEPWQHDRHLVRPGVTGLWQVSQRGQGMMHEHIGLDIDYIRSISMATDVRLLAATVPALLKRGKAW